MRVGGVEEPLRPGERPLVDAEAHELDAEAVPAMLLEDVDVREIRLDVPVRDRAREPDLRRPVVQPDDARGAVDQRVLRRARPPLRQYDSPWR